MIAAGIDRGERAAADPVRGQVGEEQRDLAGLVARDDDGEIGDAAVRHRPLAAGQPAADRADLDMRRDRDCRCPPPARSSRSPSHRPASAAGAASAPRCRPAGSPRWRDRRTKRTAPAPARGRVPRPARTGPRSRGRRRRYCSGIAAPSQPISAIARQSAGGIGVRRLPARGARPSAAIAPPGSAAPGRAAASGRRRSRSSWRRVALRGPVGSLHPRTRRAKSSWAAFRFQSDIATLAIRWRP